MKKTVVFLLLLAASGCAPMNYVPGPEATTSLARARGACRVTAIEATRGEEGIAGGVLLRAAYAGCMEANGFVQVAP